MTKLKHNQTYILAIIFIVVIGMFVGQNSVKGNGLSPDRYSFLSNSETHKPAFNDTSGFVCPTDISIYTDLNACSGTINDGLNVVDPDATLKYNTDIKSG